MLSILSVKLHQTPHCTVVIRHCSLPARVLSVAFMAPEVIIGSENVGRSADIWSLGCVLIEMATGKVTLAVEFLHGKLQMSDASLLRFQ